MFRAGSIKLGFIFKAVLVFVVASNFANAKTSFFSKKTSPMQKALELNFPAMPAELVAKIKGKKSSADNVRVDPTATKDWALSNIGFYDLFNSFNQPLKNNLSACSSEVIVAVVDTGIDYTHPGLRENIWVNAGESGLDSKGRDKSTNGVDDDNNGFIDDVVGWDFVNEVPLPMDTHGHGTHIAGIIAAKPNKLSPITGVCSNATIMPLKYYDNSGLGYNNLQNTVRAFQYAVKMGAHIINYSGGGADPAPSERAAVDEARRAGILVIAAAGNDGHNNDVIPYYPASYELDNIVSVASVNRRNELLASSNFGTHKVHVAAPGLGILSTLPVGKTGTMSGTSQATAFISGTAALLLSQMKHKSGYDYHKMKAWIEQGVHPLPTADKHINVHNGVISLAKAMQAQRDDLSGVRKAPEQFASAPQVATKPSVKDLGPSSSLNIKYQ